MSAMSASASFRITSSAPSGHVAENKKLDFEVNLAGELPRGMHTDAKRLQQILKNLLSNAFKFTEQGMVSLQMTQATEGWSTDNESLNRARASSRFSVIDTGIGIPPEKQQIIFEAFQQADGSTSRKYGGTGLGLAISREMARLLGGEIRLASTPDEGSTFTLYLPQTYLPARALRRPTSSAEAAPAPLADQDAASPTRLAIPKFKRRSRRSPTIYRRSSPATRCCSSSKTT